MEYATTIEPLHKRVTEAKDQNNAHFRTSRYFNADGYWYFITREDPAPHGPYVAKKDAQQALGDYIALMRSFV
ncbi:MAG TPA: DUF6316 family protein [Pseudomonadales bacterium]